MGIAPQGIQHPFQVVKRCPRMADDLRAVQDGMDPRQPQRVDDHDGPSIVTVRGRSFGQPRIGRLRDHDPPGIHAKLKRFPQFKQGSGADHRLGLAPARPISHAKPFGVPRRGQHMARSHRCAKGLQKGGGGSDGDLIRQGLGVQVRRHGHAPVGWSGMRAIGVERAFRIPPEGRAGNPVHGRHGHSCPRCRSCRWGR